MFRITLAPGEALILNTLHGRDNLTSKAQYNGHDRWLIRMYGFDSAIYHKNFNYEAT